MPRWAPPGSDEEEDNDEEENLRHDLLDPFHREETLQKEREETAGRLARKILGGNDDELTCTEGAFGSSEEGDKLQLTDAGRKFLDDWPLCVLQWLLKENASNHTLLEELCDEHKGTLGAVKQSLGNDYASKLRAFFPGGARIPSYSLVELQTFARVISSPKHQTPPLDPLPTTTPTSNLTCTSACFP